MGVPAPWTKHAQIVWEHRAADPSLPLWLRIVCLAYGQHEANGHANFKPGALACIFGKPGTATEPFKRAHRATIYDAIQTALRRGFLAAGSCAKCLVVPSHAIEGPRPGNAFKPCPVHSKMDAHR